jgi:integrase
MPQKRKSNNRGLPPRWRFRYGGYYYRVPEGQEDQWDGKKEYLLGRKLSDAYREFAARMQYMDDTNTFDKLIARYRMEVTPDKSPATQKQELLYLDMLAKVYGSSAVAQFTPQNAYRLRDQVTNKRGATTANHLLGTLSHLMTKAIEWGVIDTHPIVGKVKKNKIVVTRRVPEMDDIYKALTIANPIIQSYVELKLMTGLRRTDMLSIKLNDIKDDGVHITPSKTSNSSGKSIIIEYDDYGLMMNVISQIKSLPRPIGSMYLFCTRKGKPFIQADKSCSAFKSMWQRWQTKALAAGLVEWKFAERYLRNATASAMDTTQEAQKLLAHSSPRTTQKHYRVHPERIQPFIKKR